VSHFTRRTIGRGDISNETPSCAHGSKALRRCACSRYGVVGAVARFRFRSFENQRNRVRHAKGLLSFSRAYTIQQDGWKVFGVPTDDEGEQKQRLRRIRYNAITVCGRYPRRRRIPKTTCPAVACPGIFNGGTL